MKRGPKVKTAANSRPGSGLIPHGGASAPSDLTGAGQAEYDRLVGVLEAKGTLDRVDLGVVAEAARIKDLLDRSYRLAGALPDRDTIKMIGLLTSQRRGLLRELGLTLIPSRSLVRTNPVPAEEDPLASRIKLSG